MVVKNGPSIRSMQYGMAGKTASRQSRMALGLPGKAFSFGHGIEHALPDNRILLDSYHCSRYNTQTRRLTPEMFQRVFARARALIE